MTAIKICGITRAEDAELAVALGAQALGFVLWPKSPRATTLSVAARIIRAVPPLVATVAVLVDPTVDEVLAATRDGGFSAVQVHGPAPDWEAIRAMSLRVIRAVRLADDGDGVEPAVDDEVAILLDAHDPVRMGGSGQVIDWNRAAGIAARRRVMLAGGLTAANVGDAIRLVAPYGVDVASGVEERPGIKDAGKMRAFVEAVRRAQVRSDACK